jgi:hypothetical protein
VNRTSCLAFLAVILSSTAALAAGEEGAADAGDDAGAEGESTTADAATVAGPAPAGAKPAKSEAATLGDVAAEKSPFSWEPFGYLRLQYIFVQNDPNVAFVGRDDGFEIQNARFGVRGSYQKRVRYQFSIDGAVDERMQQNTPQGRLRVGLRDAFADVVTGGRVFVRAGFFQTWADPQRLVADTNRELVDRPIWSRGVRTTEGWFTPALPPGRSIGAALRVEPERPMAIGFELAVQNGADEFASNNDNDLPAVSAAAMLRLGDDGFVVAGARYNPRTVGELPFRQDETDLQGSVGLQLNMTAVRVGAGAVVQRTTYGSTGGPVQNAFGAHGQLMVRIPAGSPVWVGYRFGILDPSSLILTDRVMEHTAGGSLGVPELRMRVQLQVTHVMEQAARELSNSRVQLAAEVTL